MGKIIPEKTYLYYVDQNDSLNGYEKQIQDCIHNQSYEYLDEVLAAQNALLELKYSKITFKFKDKVLELIQEIEKDLIPSTLF